MKKTTLTVLLAALGAGQITPAVAESFPNAPITVVVPMAAGGPTDTAARAIQQAMGAALGQSVVIENKAGAAGLIAMNFVRRATPDGYTLGVASATTHAIAPNIYTESPYDSVKDFTFIGGLITAPGVLVVDKAVAPNCEMKAFLETLKASPEKYSYGSAGVGSLSHLNGARFLQATGTNMLHVPYRGLSNAMNDLYAGQVHAVFDNVSSAMTHIKSGKVCALAVQAPKRLESLPDVPTYAELNMEELNKPTWYGLVGPAGIPKERVEALNQALNKALASPEVVTLYERQGVAAAPGSADDFAKKVASERQMWADTTAEMNFEKFSVK
ncbi:tripartite tricarboxylate transporter substrate binding protein [Bordetella sp. 15P40C-2]|uniref:Bug family tripartite tricarboxylate transporter substrate binding protein n=1 Tax=Bordetella sp. 15P40C-2 TaxID=2572246 RepID=UPI001325CFE0|nr:tripartite tricarboxylate transporter substrate binding protein [Bordetella sp. 15P40C-2]MVW70750.1 tripartite tricarboxylate transporter substrate binding protein [Bordetella sp. 15P40C-2]